MKFEKAAIEEGIEIINQGIADDKNKVFTINGQGPYSIYDISRSTHPEFIRAYKTLKNPKVRSAIAKNINLLKMNEPKIADISLKVTGDVVITADNGAEIIRI